MTTIKDVAKEAGLAVGTVSRYLNGEQLKPVNQQAIEAAIEKLGYETNTIARSMKTGKTMTIGVIVPFLTNMFSMRVIESIERDLQKYQYSVIITDCSGDSKKELERIEFLKRRQVDGFVLMPSGNLSASIQKAAGNIPLVLVDRILDQQSFDSVIIDNERVTYDHVANLLKLGFRRIGILEGPQTISTAVQRRIGFEKALASFGLKKEYAVSCDTYSFEEGYRGMKQLETYHLEAVFASNYELSVGAVNAISTKEIKILGFDTFEIPVRYQENYTGIRQPVEEIGRIAAELLRKRMENPFRNITNIVI